MGGITTFTRGSPPRVRGKGIESRGDLRHQRITPARAGKRTSCSLTKWAWRDHPRACGEKQQHQPTPWYVTGSPPRVRGKAGQENTLDVRLGITPARAGKSTGRRLLVGREGDHPRACGEKIFALKGGAFCAGSPPRVRGKGKGGKEKVCILRITPARAGKRAGKTQNKTGNGDHPRACGEKSSQRFQGEANSGSPPRVRGKGPSAAE